MGCFKKLYGKTTIDSSDSDELNKEYKMELEYYQLENSTSKHQYGIEIIKTEYKPDYTKVENKKIKYITNDEIEANQILDIFRTNQVTPINSEEVIVDLFRKKF